MADQTPVCYLLSDDLLFVSRIAGTARDLGLAVQSARSAAALLERARQAAPGCVLIDLGNPGLDLATLVSQLKELGTPRIVAYGSHVDAAALRAAREAGCDPVLPRSKFVEELPAALPAWLAGPPPEGRA